METLIDTTFSGKDISSAVSLYEYTVVTSGMHLVQVRFGAVSGDGDYSVWVTLNDGDAQTDDIVAPKTEYTASVGETAFWFSSIKIPLMAGDVINIFGLGQGADTSETGSVRIFLDKVLIADDAIDADVIATDAIDADAIADGAIDDAAIAADLKWFPSGAVDWPYTVTDNDTGLPIEGVEVWLTTDIGGTNRVWKGDTDTFGVAKDVHGNNPQLDPGTYYVWRQKAGYTFVDPDTEVVS